MESKPSNIVGMGAFFSVSNWDDHNELLAEIQQGRVKCGKAPLENLSGADISGADISGADISGADISGADISGADISGADISGADISGADISGADISGADISGADMSGAKDLSGAHTSNTNTANKTNKAKNMPTLDNGDCFYSSIYRSSKERKDVFDKINKELGLVEPEEYAFISAFREKVAKEVEEDKLPSNPGTNTDVYNSLSTTSSTEPDNYKEIVNAYPSWFKEEFGPGKEFGERPDFLKRLASHVRKSREWVSEIEVEIVKRILESLHIKIDVTNINGQKAINTNTKRNLKKGDDDVLYLINHGEAHYTYLSFNDSENSSTTDTPVEEHAVEESKANEPKANEPKANEPKANEPKANEPKAEEPKANDSKAEEPKSEEHKINEQKGGRVMGTYKARESKQRRTRKRRRNAVNSL